MFNKNTKKLNKINIYDHGNVLLYKEIAVWLFFWWGHNHFCNFPQGFLL